MKCRPRSGRTSRNTSRNSRSGARSSPPAQGQVGRAGLVGQVRFRPLLFLAAALAVAGVAAPLAQETDLDQFMRRVLARRDDNWKKLQQYILDEREQIELRSNTRRPLWGERRDYT